jgi:hypothetical protein
MTLMLLWSRTTCAVIFPRPLPDHAPAAATPRSLPQSGRRHRLADLRIVERLAASVWVGDIVTANLLDMRSRQLDRAADDFADELNLSFALRLQSVRALASMLATKISADNQPELRKILANLQRASPELERIAMADASGWILAYANGEVEGSNLAERSWFVLGLSGSRIGDLRVVPMTIDASPGCGSLLLVWSSSCANPIMRHSKWRNRGNQHQNNLGMIQVALPQVGDNARLEQGAVFSPP